MPTTLHISRDRQPVRSGRFAVTGHAWKRMTQRCIPQHDVELALKHGRAFFPDGRKACYYVVGKREIQAASARKVDLRHLEGVTVVVCSRTGDIETVYRNRDFSRHAKRY